MRLAKDKVEFLKNSIKSISKDAKLYLFGSRVDDTKRGGDIDILIVSKELTKKHLRKIRVEFYKLFGEQKIDIVLDDGTSDEPFIKIIKNKAVLL